MARCIHIVIASLTWTTGLLGQTVFQTSSVRVTSTTGDVSVASSGGQGVSVVVIGSEEPRGLTSPSSGAVITTSSDSQATISVPGAGAALLGADTQVRLPKTGEKGHSLELLRGKLFLSISAEEVKKQGEASFRLKTPAALLAVKGTKFFAFTEKSSETCGVNEGSIGAFAVASRKVTELPAGNALEMAGGRLGAPRTLNTQEKAYEIQYELAAHEGRFTNSLGMKFAAVPGTKVLFCVHETRYRDYAAYAATFKPSPRDEYTASLWKNQVYGGFTPGKANEDHPVTNVTSTHAKGFVSWLSAKEGRKYRLPTDEEWSFAVGIGRLEKRQADTKVEDLDGKIQDVFPWGSTWPPASRAGNYCDESYHKQFRPQDPYLPNYDDGFPTTAAVMSFQPNKFGMFDLGGNAWEWVYEDMAAAQSTEQNPPVVLRGGSFLHSAREMLLSSTRLKGAFGEPDKTFRIVMVLE